MPLLKVYVDALLWSERGEVMRKSLTEIHSYLCETFKVDASVCQILVIPLHGLPNQPLIAAEIQFMSKSERTRELILSAGDQLRRMLGGDWSESVVIRITQLDPERYIAIK